VIHETLSRLTIVALVVSLCALTVAAQASSAQPPAVGVAGWVSVSPAGEWFTAQMPKQPTPVEQRIQANGLNASGLRYAAAANDQTTFIVWSMKGFGPAGPLGAGSDKRWFPGGAFYLDDVAELAWELLLAPELERLEREKVDRRRLEEINPGMRYRRDFDMSGWAAREYSIRLEKGRGPVYVCADGAQVYIVVALGADEGDARLKQFLDSFTLKRTPPASPPLGAGIRSGGGNAGGDAPADYSRPFKQSEVAKKATLTYKPEPSFTQQARKFNVEGVVRLRAVLHSSGTVQSIAVVKGLPHGLTEKCIAAAKQIQFNPAEKDGHTVSQYVTLEYNFHIY
jgi:TonB family protein